VTRPSAGDRGTPPRSPHAGRNAGAPRDARPAAPGGSYPRRHRAVRHLLREERAGFDPGQEPAVPGADGEGQGAHEPVATDEVHGRDPMERLEPMERLAAALDQVLGASSGRARRGADRCGDGGRSSGRTGASPPGCRGWRARWRNRRAKTFVDTDRARGGRTDAGRLAQQAVARGATRADRGTRLDTQRKRSAPSRWGGSWGSNHPRPHAARSRTATSAPATPRCSPTRSDGSTTSTCVPRSRPRCSKRPATSTPSSSDGRVGGSSLSAIRRQR
jgi:hypothetical protein